MDYRQNLQEALDKNKLREFLEGTYPYNIENSQYTPGLEPTNISVVLSKAIYKEYVENPCIKNIKRYCPFSIRYGKVVIKITTYSTKCKRRIAKWNIEWRRLFKYKCVE